MAVARILYLAFGLIVITYEPLELGLRISVLK